LVRVLGRYIVTNRSALVEDKTVIVLFQSQNNIYRMSWGLELVNKIKGITYNARNLTEGLFSKILRHFVFAIGEIDHN